jgi:hypothetical protein
MKTTERRSEDTGGFCSIICIERLAHYIYVQMFRIWDLFDGLQFHLVIIAVIIPHMLFYHFQNLMLPIFVSIFLSNHIVNKKHIVASKHLIIVDIIVNILVI